MILEKGAEEEGQVLDEVLLIILTILVGLSDVGHQRQHLVRHMFETQLKKMTSCRTQAVFSEVTSDHP